MDVVNRIFEIIKEKKVTHHYVCSRLGVSDGYFYQLKSRKTPLTDDEIDRISVVLDVSSNYLKYGFDIASEASFSFNDFKFAMFDNLDNPTEADKKTLSAICDIMENYQ